MTVTELMELLEDQNPEAEVLIATQPNWPLQFSVGDVVNNAPDEEELEDEWYGRHQRCDNVGGYPPVCRDCDDSFETFRKEKEADAEGDAVYIVEGGHPYDRRPYAPRNVFDRARV